MHPPAGRIRLRKHYLLAGVALALALATVIVAVGVRSGGTSGTAGASGTDSLPPGHPSTEGGSSVAASPAPSASASFKEKIAGLQAKLADDPDDVNALLQLGDAYFMAQRNDRAAEVFADVLSLQPDNTSAKVKLAMVWHADGATKRAEKAISQILTDKPDDQEAHYSLAIIYFSSDRSQQARDEWQKAAGIDPSSEIGRRSQTFVDLLDGKDSEGESAHGGG
jgi:cytochrome c-type biogenesis protein CcmH/NrfG